MSAPWLTIVIPAYNEQHDLGATLEAVQTWAASRNEPAEAASAQPRAPDPPSAVEVIIVDDGSTDATADVVRRFLAHDRARAAERDPAAGIGEPRPPGRACFRLLQHHPNRGKGYAVRQGMRAAAGELILLSDADLSAPLAEIDRLLPWVGGASVTGREGGYDIVIGSRDMPGARLDPPQPLARRLAAWAFRALRRRLLLPELRDTQCGFKLFTARAAREILRRATVDGFLFDCELLAIAARLGFRIREVGIVWRNRAVSRVRPWREAMRALPVLWSIHRRWGRGSEPRC